MDKPNIVTKSFDIPNQYRESNHNANNVQKTRTRKNIKAYFCQANSMVE